MDRGAERSADPALAFFQYEVRPQRAAATALIKVRAGAGGRESNFQSTGWSALRFIAKDWII